MQVYLSAKDKQSNRFLTEDGSNIIGTVQHKTILVVEDSEDVRYLAESILRSLGYGVITAANGEDAMRVLETDHQIDLLFTDLLMPGGIDGLMLAEKVRQILPNLPVVLTTGYIDEFTDSLPSFEVLPKPYKRAELEDMIKLAFRRYPDSLQ